MIARLNGQIDSYSETGVVVMVGGVGYEVYVGRRFVNRLIHDGIPKDPVWLIVYQHYMQDRNPVLYGFLSEAERDWFQRMIKADGVGPVSAINIMEAMTYDQFMVAVERNDQPALQVAKGVGPKVAAKIVEAFSG